MLTYAAYLPHPPIVLPEIGQEELARCEKTVDSLKKISKEIVKVDIETVILMSPHHFSAPGTIPINVSEVYHGSFQSFGYPDLKFELKGDSALATGLVDEGRAQGLKISYLIEPELDHGVMVPLYYPMQEGFKPNLVVIGYSGLKPEDIYSFGKLLFDYIKKSPKKIAFIGSGDLSHRLTEDAPAGYNPRGKEFDAKVVNLIKNKKVKDLVNLDPHFVEDAGQCGYKSLITLMSIMENTGWTPDVYSYEGPFGVGYCVTSYKGNK